MEGKKVIRNRLLNRALTRLRNRTQLKTVLRASTLVALSLTLLPGAGLAGVQLAKEVPYSSDAKVRQPVRDSCAVGEKLANAVAASASDVELVDRAGGGNRLEMTIVRVHAPGGGPFSGPKWIEVTGTLRKGGRVAGDFRAKRMSLGGPWGVFIGTCGILDRVAKVMGQDISAFIEAPSSGAKLGDAR